MKIYNVLFRKMNTTNIGLRPSSKRSRRHYGALITEFKDTAFDISFNINFILKDSLRLKCKLYNFILMSLSDLLLLNWKIYKNGKSDIIFLKVLRNSNEINIWLNTSPKFLERIWNLIEYALESMAILIT